MYSCWYSKLMLFETDYYDFVGNPGLLVVDVELVELVELVEIVDAKLKLTSYKSFNQCLSEYACRT